MEKSLKSQETVPQKPTENAAERATRMATIRQQIADGTYRVDSDALAETLIQRLQQKPRRRVA
jgi:anti-sigma28 factor (negative regulator of flagellin synthesis)